jgi:excisionase family DNA binding protein
MIETFLTPAEVAKLLKVDIETVCALAQQHKLRGIKLRGQWRFVESDVRHWLQRQVEKSHTSGVAS